MKRVCLLSVSVLALVFTGCSDRQDYFAASIKNVTVALESPLTACTSAYPGFIDHDYAFNVTLTPEYPKANPLPLVAQFTCENAGSFNLSFGNKKYSPGDTIMFKSLFKKMKLKVTKPGTYRFLMQFFKENNNGEMLGKYEFTFVIGQPDLNICIVRDGRRVENLEETENFLEYEGSFVVRVLSEKEELNKGRLTLTTNITGSSVQVLNWKDNEAKISQSDDLPQSIDFVVNFKNSQLGKTKFLFTAQSQNSSVILRDSMMIQETRPGTLNLQTTYNKDKRYYSRPLLWVGQTDSVEYLITPDPKAVSNVYRMKFEMKDITKLWIFNTGDESKQNASTMYDANIWHNFSNKMTGKLYYVFPSPTAYSDTIFISLQNGEIGPITRYKLFVSCKQSNDFDFNVTFRSALVDGYDEIKLSEVVDGIVDLVNLNVTDENPHSKFDYRLSWQEMNSYQATIRQTLPKEGYSGQFDLSYQVWLGYEYGYLYNTKSIRLICRQTPTNETAGAYIGSFNWIYEIKRESDGMTKSVTRRIKIIDDRLNFEINMASGNSREYTYQNEKLTTYQIKYLTPSVSADDYTLTVTSSNENVADVYLMKKDLSFVEPVVFNSEESPPASHNTGGSMLSTETMGKIQIKGKQSGMAVLTFTLKHKKSGATRSITKTVATIDDPVQYVIEPASTMDLKDKERAAIPFNGQYHTYQNPRFRIRLQKYSFYNGNTEGSASVVFSKMTSLTNVAILTISGGNYYKTNISYGTHIQLEYDTDYFVTVAAPSTHPWNVPIGSEQFFNIKMIKATDQQTKIEAEYNDKIKYTLREYQMPKFVVIGEVGNESACGNQKTETYYEKVNVPEARVVIFPGSYDAVTKTTCVGTFNVVNLKTNVTWNDGFELYSNPNITGSITGTYSREKTVGNRIEMFLDLLPPEDPNWNLKGPGVTVISYSKDKKAKVSDNWGYSAEVNVEIPLKITYGIN